ncbi:MAG: hypothetical protein A2Y41_07570 [Spirochaetes bacterium GWB1_36_13]|nr:MAG: hypothetical protein A2Y41_07570 [Spirochaetes bacterium GWB1_36_13]
MAQIMNFLQSYQDFNGLKESISSDAGKQFFKLNENQSPEKQTGESEKFQEAVKKIVSKNEEKPENSKKEPPSQISEKEKNTHSETTKKTQTTHPLSLSNLKEEKTGEIIVKIKKVIETLKKGMKDKKPAEEIELLLASGNLNLNQLIEKMKKLIEKGEQAVKETSSHVKIELQNPKNGIQKNPQELLGELKALADTLKTLSHEPEISKNSSFIQAVKDFYKTESKDEKKSKTVYDVRISPHARQNKTENNQGNLALGVKKIDETLHAKETRKEISQLAMGIEKSSFKLDKQTVKRDEISKNRNSVSNDIPSHKTGENILLKDNKSFQTEAAKELSQTAKMSRAQLGRTIVDQIGEKVTGFIGKSFSQVTVNLRPEELGAIKIVLEMKDDVIKGKIIVENPDVKEIVKENIREVKAVLEQNGIQLGDMEVSSGETGQSFENAERENLLQKTVAENTKVSSLLEQSRIYRENWENGFDSLESNFYLRA